MGERAVRSGFTPTAIAASVLVHLGIAAALTTTRPWSAPGPAEPVEFEIVEPPPEAPPPPEPPAPVEPIKVARASPRKLAPPETPPSEAPPPPPPENTPPPEPPAEPVRPVFGVTVDSTITGESPVAVAVGNTLATADRRPGNPVVPPGPIVGGAPGGSVAGSAAFAPVADSFVRDFPVELQSVQAPYPEQARRMDVEGTVRLRVGIDEKGRTRDVKVIGKVGHGLDEAAVTALRAFRWKPAIAHDGRAVSVRIPYNYIFRLPR